MVGAGFDTTSMAKPPSHVCAIQAGVPSALYLPLGGVVSHRASTRSKSAATVARQVQNALFQPFFKLKNSIEQINQQDKNTHHQHALAPIHTSVTVSGEWLELGI